MTNIFREAKELLQKKDAGGELSEDELQLIGTAKFPLLIRNCPYLRDMAVRDCLEVLAEIVEGDGGAG